MLALGCAGRRGGGGGLRRFIWCGTVIGVAHRGFSTAVQAGCSAQAQDVCRTGGCSTGRGRNHQICSREALQRIFLAHLYDKVPLPSHCVPTSSAIRFCDVHCGDMLP